MRKIKIRRPSHAVQSDLYNLLRIATILSLDSIKYCLSLLVKLVEDTMHPLAWPLLRVHVAFPRAINAAFVKSEFVPRYFDSTDESCVRHPRSEAQRMKVRTIGEIVNGRHTEALPLRG